MSVQLRSSRSPNLPVGPAQYEQRYHDQLNNILRLYFNELDNINATLLGPHPGQVLNLPYVAASDSTDQYATATDAPTLVRWNTLEGVYGWTLNSPGSATTNFDGVYKITYSLQFVNTANAQHTATCWLKVNGVDLPNSATSFSIPARKDANTPGFTCAYSEVAFTVDAGDDIELWWATDQAYNPTGPVNGVYLFHDPVQTTPYPRPAVPSAIGSIVFVSRKIT